MKIYPLLQAQLGVFMQCIQHPTSTQYNVPIYIEIPSTIDIDRLANAWEKVLDERKELHTRFMIDQEDEVRQWSDDDMRIPVIRRKCTDAELHDYIDHAFVRPFDLLSGEPLFRVELVETEKGAYQLMDGHHCVTDGMAFTLVINQIDLTSAYAGTELEPHDYGMYEAAEEEVVSFGTEIYERAKAYYAEKFAGMDFATISKSVPGTMGKMVRRSSFVNRQLCDEWSKANGTQVNLLFQAAFSHVISILTRQEKVAYFTINHGRIDKRLRHSIGMFVKSVPILVNAAGETKVIDFIKGFRTEMMSTIRYGNYPFNHFCRDLRMTPGVSFNFQAIPDMEEIVRLGNERLYFVQPIRQEVNGDMTVFIFFKGDNYEIRVESSSGMNDEVTLQMMSDAMLATIKNMMADPDANLGDIPIILPEDGKALISLGKGEELSYDHTETFIGLFRKQVALYPDSTAVVDEVSSITYAELDRQSDLLAHALVDSGVGTDSFVAVMLPRRKEFLVSVLAVFKAGGAYIPLDSDYPNDRLLYMLEDSAARVLITTKELLDEKCKEGDFTAENILFLNEFDFSGGCAPINNSYPESLAYMIYTSGSTGKPKGVMIEHKGLRNFVEWRNHLIAIKQAEACAQHASFSFDASLADLITPLSAGGEVHIISSLLRQNMEGLYNYFKQHAIIGGTLSTQLGMELLNQYDLSLRFLMMGGEKLKPTRPSSVKVINGYGPTEFSVCSSYHIVEQGREYANIPIGCPVPNTMSAIVDGAGNLVPRGMVGELCLIGCQIARGYWNRPELTAEKFVDCPFIEGEKMYRTGDLARWNEESELECLGRIDFQVKLRGFRIELGEIESAMAKYAGIQSSVVEVKEINGTQHLCGYYTSGESINEEELREYLWQTLTDYMVPTAFMCMEAMPLTPNGKVNRKALPMPEIKAEEMVTPKTELEQSLFVIASELLGTTAFGITTNLISMGLTSMGAIKISLAVQRELNLNLSTKDILQKPVICKWTDLVDKEQNQLKVYVKREKYPLLELQRGMYSRWEQHLDDVQYNIPIALKLTDVDAKLLHVSLKKVLEVHPYLKVRLERENDEIVQIRHEDTPTHILVKKLDMEPDFDFFQSRVRPFNLLKDELYRIAIYTSPKHSYLFMDFHHIAFDGTSLNILLTDLQKAYKGEELLPESFTTYDYSLDCEAWMKTEAYKETITYFRNLTDGVTPALYPPSAGGIANEQSQIWIGSIPRPAVKKACRNLGVTENCFLLTTFMQLLHRTTGENHLLIETISNGRSSTHVSNTVGLFIQELPIVSHRKRQTVADAMLMMQSQFFELSRYDMYSNPESSEWYSRVRANVEFIYQGEVMDEQFCLGSASAEWIKLRPTTVKIPIDLYVTPVGDSYQLLFEYDGGLYTEADMIRLKHDLQILILSVAAADSQQDITLI